MSMYQCCVHCRRNGCKELIGPCSGAIVDGPAPFCCSESLPPTGDCQKMTAAALYRWLAESQSAIVELRRERQVRRGGLRCYERERSHEILDEHRGLAQ